MARAVGTEVVILDLASGTYFGIEAVGARAWEILREGHSLGEAVDMLLAEYDVARPELERDLFRLAGDLVDRGLLKTA